MENDDHKQEEFDGSGDRAKVMNLTVVIGGRSHVTVLSDRIIGRAVIYFEPQTKCLALRPWGSKAAQFEGCWDLGI